ncbi:MAG: hypothetical protein Satyrvirus1_26 [Satyrvirus sp.]|uniref:Dynamin N-terminal domain-containing protein n=1 Tax=Satyrvirus sp. TaxID=2487771 RepID=A0A3G5ACP1_9VIRU|nr:MAG: hypothetical protein Satyrvirus1_26 [Satyrvirus sp.]
MEINIGIVGAVSVGKSSFLNAISGQQYSDTEIKKTTMIPQVYFQNVDSDNKSNAYIIRRANREANESIMKIIDLNKFTNKQCQPIYHNIDRICDIFDPKIIEPELKINIYDIPGLNDSASKNIYFEWIKQNIKIFDIIIFMTDITKGLNNSDEIEVLKLLFESMTKLKSKMICLINKCDDIYFDEDQNDLVFEEKEQENIYIQANNILVDVAKSYGFTTESNRFTAFLPISSENCFIYRALVVNPAYELDSVHQNRLCKNECGSQQWKKMSSEEKEEVFEKILSNLKDSYNSKILDTGYLAVKSVIQNTITSNKTEFILNHIDCDIKELETFEVENTTAYIELINKFKKRYEQIKTIGCVPCYDTFWKTIETTITNYLNSVLKMDTKITRGNNFIDFKDFDNMHSLLQEHCMNLISLVENLLTIPECPSEFLKLKEKQLIAKLLNIYDQFTLIDAKDQVHISPNNLLCYLRLINTYAPNNFSSYSKIFLEFSCNSRCKHIATYQKELYDLLCYVIENPNQHVEECCAMVCKILVSKQIYVQNKFYDQYFSYLCYFKKILQNYMDYTNHNNEYTVFDLLYEVTKKNISLYLGTNSVSNIYKQEIDYNKVECLFNKFFDTHKTISPLIDVDFDSKILKFLFEKKLNYQFIE